MPSELGEVIDTIADSDGDRIAVEALGPAVYLTATSHGFSACVRLDADLRDRFAKAWAEAERQAEAHGAQAGACGCPDITRCGHAEAHGAVS